MRVLISGSKGLIGAALSGLLEEKGHHCIRLVRSRDPLGGGQISWDPASGRIDKGALEGLDAAVHLAGESIAARWTEAKKARIRDSRITGTRLLATALAGVSSPPRVLVCASAVGYYGDGGDEILREDSPKGRGFLSDVCREWEEAAAAASGRGIRVVHLRFGPVLAASGGALGRMLAPFKAGLGGRIGSGRQWMSWISVDDAAGAAHHALITASLRGPVNAVSPGPVTNAGFASTLARVLRRPALLPLPAFAARLALGEMADELLLRGQRVEPAKLLATGYSFRHPDLEEALRDLLTRP